MKVSFYKNQLSTPYVLSHPGGKAYFKTRPEAERVEAVLRNLLASAPSSITTSDRWREVREILGGVDPIDAARFYVSQHPPSFSIPTLSDAISNFLSDQSQSGLRAKYLSELGRSVRKFANDHPLKAIAEISVNDVQAHITQLKSAHSRRDRIKHLSSFFSWCRRRRWLTSNPCVYIVAPAASVSHGHGFLALQEVCRLLRAAEKHEPSMVPFFALQLFCGIRTEELKHLEWPSVDLSSGIHLRYTKTGVLRVITWIPPNLVDWLAGRQRKCGRVVPSNFRKKRDHVVCRATHDSSGGRLFHMPQNCLRRTFATYACAFHDSWHPVMDQLGHKNARMLFEHYRNYVSRSQAIQFFSIKPENHT